MSVGLLAKMSLLITAVMCGRRFRLEDDIADFHTRRLIDSDRLEIIITR